MKKLKIKDILFRIVIFSSITFAFIFYIDVGIKTLRAKSVTLTNGKNIWVEIADSSQERKIGLMYRLSLSLGRTGTLDGMLFIFDSPGNYSFWMKNTYIPLDILWLDEAYKIVFIQKNTRPCKEFDKVQLNCPIYLSYVPAKYVLEVPAGWTDNYKYKTGDILIKKIE